MIKLSVSAPCLEIAVSVLDLHALFNSLDFVSSLLGIVSAFFPRGLVFTQLK